MHDITPQVIAQRISSFLSDSLSTQVKNASEEQLYRASAWAVREILSEKHRRFTANALSHAKKQVHYISMEFLPGRSLKNNLYNLNLTEVFTQALSSLGTDLNLLYRHEPDAGLGNGGLGRLAACYLDGMATNGFWGRGYSILYEFGIFKQKITDGWQTELPDHWLPGGEIWLTPRPEQATEVRFGGVVRDWWENGSHRIEHTGYATVTAVPYDLYISGYNTDAVTVLRLYKAQSPGVDMEKFNRGDYLGAFGATALAETISKVLYPNDSHLEGKKLRLKQQYFLASATIGDIIRQHLNAYGSLSNLAEKNAVQLNDTHPVLAIPELLRVLLDDFGYGWEQAFDICGRMFSYTNHTMMREALEEWDEALVGELLPRVSQLIYEVNERFCRLLKRAHGSDDAAISRMAPLAFGRIRMANLAVAVCHSVNGVSKLHSKLITQALFPDYFKIAPYKFKNVTNGIAARRWLCQSNPGLTTLLRDAVGGDFSDDLSRLSRLKSLAGDVQLGQKALAAKRENKQRLFDFIADTTNLYLSPDAICDVQVKRLHEYKRQHLNALSIIERYLYIKANPHADVTPRVFVFGAKAAPGYYFAKQVIKLLCTLASCLAKDPLTRDRLRVVFLEDYRVTLSELIMPAADFSHQLSLAGTEASGTGNMKLMLNGAVTIGTKDGANIEIADAVGLDNILLFGMNADAAFRLAASGYDPNTHLAGDEGLSAAVDALVSGELGDTFSDLHEALRHTDRYMALADYASYRQAMTHSEALYADRSLFAKTSLINTAAAGIFSADRAVKQYASEIWGLVP